MQGAGLGYALLPVLRSLHRDAGASLKQALSRHSGFFNSHPYLSTVALAALARMESESADTGQIERFKVAIVSPLGSLGDRLVWARWRPICSLASLWLFLAGAAWWIAVIAFLLLYNAFHLGLRVWGLRLGWREGREVGGALMGSPLRRLPDRLTIPLAVVTGGVLAPLALELGSATGAGPLATIAVALAFAAVGIWHPAVAGRLAVLGLLLAALLFVSLGHFVW
jgi:mannose/fructose/N-acetylgalactosamine-specific phosphotransferase system component IID